VDETRLTLPAMRWSKAQQLAKIVYERDIAHASAEKAIEAIAEVIHYGDGNMKRLQERLRLYESSEE
jgi:hypothetical protein